MNIVEALVTKNKLRQALNKLSEYIPASEKQELTQVNLLLSRLSTWEQASISGTESTSSLNIERNRIVMAVLSIAEEFNIPEIEQEATAVRTKSNSNKNQPRKEPNQSTAKIYFSYAWGDPQEEGESREKIVDDLYEALKKEGFQIIRDKMDLNYGGLISDFMKEIGEGDLVVVFVSRKYAKSPYCMFELYEIARNSRWDKKEFAKRILPVPVEFIDFNDPDILGEHFDYWDQEEKKWANFIQKRINQISNAQSIKYHNIKNINQNFGNLSDWLVDINASTTKLLSENDFELVKKAIVSRLNKPGV